MGIVNSPSQIGEDWKTELLTFGHRDHKGRPYEAEVRDLPPASMYRV